MFEQACGLFRPFCHQLPDCCPRVGEVVLPLCGRCAGLYAGCGLAGLWLAVAAARGRSPWVGKQWAVVSAGLLLLCAADGLTGASYAWGLGNGARFLLGYGAGLSAAALATLLAPWRGLFAGRAGTRPVAAWPPRLLPLPPALLLVPSVWSAALLTTLCLWGWACYQVLALLAMTGLGLWLFGRAREWAEGP
jgi:hypothetical protein